MGKLGKRLSTQVLPLIFIQFYFSLHSRQLISVKLISFIEPMLRPSLDVAAKCSALHVYAKGLVNIDKQQHHGVLRQAAADRERDLT